MNRSLTSGTALALLLKRRQFEFGLLGFAVRLVYATSRAILVELETLRCLALVLCSRIGALFAFGAGEANDNSCFCFGHYVIPGCTTLKGSRGTDKRPSREATSFIR